MSEITPIGVIQEIKVVVSVIIKVLYLHAYIKDKLDVEIRVFILNYNFQCVYLTCEIGFAEKHDWR